MILKKAREILDRLLHPMPLHTFLDEILDKRVVKLDAVGQEVRRDLLLGSDPIQVLLGAYSELAPNISSHAADSMGPAPKVEAVPDAAAFQAKIAEFHARRYTVRLPNVRNLSPRLDELARALELWFHEPVGVHAFWSRAGAKAPIHHDEYDLIAIQLLGRKRWFVSTDASELPNAWPQVPEGPERLDRFTTIEMTPGDLLYLPRGTKHRVDSVSDSIHLSVGFVPLTLREALVACVDHLSDLHRPLRETVGLRIALQLRTGELGDIPERLRNGMQMLVRCTAEDDFIADALQHRAGRTVAGLKKIVAPIGPPMLSLSTRVRHAPSAICHVISRGSKVDFAYPGGHHYIHQGAARSVIFIADTPEFLVHEIPGDIGDDVRLALVRKFVETNFLKPVM